MEHDEINDEEESRRPLGVTLIGGLYLFFFMLTVSSYGQPIPFFGRIFSGFEAQALVFVDSLLCLYLFLGIMKRQKLTLYLLLGYNAFEVANTLINLLFIKSGDLEKIVGEKVNPDALINTNVSVIIAILMLSLFIIRQHAYFTNRSKYLF
ncbi:MAG: hypothetical protein PHN84_13815 [Desulfuromonadaceae bacterium]|nr:hypothetical protein [Desulfuromonadaceae bacterium]MDD2855034.1 hypothetical protein [Desulfuromonadaceae bacterium]